MNERPQAAHPQEPLSATLNEQIHRLAEAAVKRSEIEPGQWWVVVNLPGMSSYSPYIGCVEAQAIAIERVAVALLEHALTYAVEKGLFAVEVSRLCDQPRSELFEQIASLVKPPEGL